MTAGAGLPGWGHCLPRRSPAWLTAQHSTAQPRLAERAAFVSHALLWQWQWLSHLLKQPCLAEWATFHMAEAVPPAQCRLKDWSAAQLWWIYQLH